MLGLKTHLKNQVKNKDEKTGRPYDIKKTGHLKKKKKKKRKKKRRNR
jgi:hypothetical protein